MASLQRAAHIGFLVQPVAAPQLAVRSALDAGSALPAVFAVRARSALTGSPGLLTVQAGLAMLAEHDAVPAEVQAGPALLGLHAEPALLGSPGEPALLGLSAEPVLLHDWLAWLALHGELASAVLCSLQPAHGHQAAWDAAVAEVLAGHFLPALISAATPAVPGAAAVALARKGSLQHCMHACFQAAWTTELA